MNIQINSDSNIDTHEAFTAHATGVVETALHRFSTRITRVEVHLSDQNSDKGGVDDKRCMIEVRMENHQPIAVTHDAATVERSIEGAADKMKRSITSMLGRLEDERRG